MTKPWWMSADLHQMPNECIFIHCSAVSVIWPDALTEAVLPYCYVHKTDIYFRLCLDFRKVERAISKRCTSWSAETIYDLTKFMALGRVWGTGIIGCLCEYCLHKGFRSESQPVWCILCLHFNLEVWISPILVYVCI